MTYEQTSYKHNYIHTLQELNQTNTHSNNKHEFKTNMYIIQTLTFTHLSIQTHPHPITHTCTHTHIRMHTHDKDYNEQKYL